MPGLREQAETDLAGILEDEVSGFGWPITVIDPEEVSAALVGFSNDVAAVIDPETGQAVSGRIAAVTLRISSLTAAGLGLPKGIADAGSKPWRVNFDDINGAAHTFKVLQSNPDRTLGIVTCLLEVYTAP